MRKKGGWLINGTKIGSLDQIEYSKRFICRRDYHQEQGQVVLLTERFQGKQGLAAKIHCKVFFGNPLQDQTSLNSLITTAYIILSIIYHIYSHTWKKKLNIHNQISLD